MPSLYQLVSCSRSHVLTELPHPPYSPYLAPSDFHLFGPLKDVVRGTRFENDESVIRAVRTWLREQETGWYSTGKACIPLFRAGVKAVDVDEDHVEK